MSASAKSADLVYVASDAVHCSVTTTDGRPTYYVVVVESEGYALVQPEGCQGWAQVSLGDLDLDDTDDFDEVVAAVIADAFGPNVVAR